MSYIDWEHPEVVAFAQKHALGCDDRERAVALFYAVRDGFRYDPYRIDLSPAGMKASQVLAQGYGWCVPKAALLAAVCRAAGIPARLGFADVRNHLSTARMRAVMQTDLFVWHGYTEIHLEGVWLKATPAFNIELCQRAGILPLDFDGRQDSLFHPFDRQGNQHMEYVRERGSYEDIPLPELLKGYQQAYPHWDMNQLGTSRDFEAEVGAEWLGGPA
jgi:transglutaminase-like putative cysteine protease